MIDFNSLANNHKTRKSFFSWLFLAVCALGFSGLYSIIPYGLRTPFLNNIFNLNDQFFTISLVIHVNLGVMMWFIAISGMLSCLIIKSALQEICYLNAKIAFIGMILLVASPIFGEAIAYKNNYVPIYNNFLFIIGLAIFIAAFIIQVILTCTIDKKLLHIPEYSVIFFNSLIFLVVIVSFILSLYQFTPPKSGHNFDLENYYELIFWAPGHLIQFCYVQIIIFAWLILSNNISKQPLVYEKYFNLINIINLIGVIYGLSAFVNYKFNSPQYYNFFTQHMRSFGGFFLIIFAILLTIKLKAAFKFSLFKQLEFTSIFCSTILISFGGAIGYLINGANVTIPAHYHGVILGITAGLMGLCFILINNCYPIKIKLATAIKQLYLYTSGQLIHVIALAISGGYGVLRKNPGVELPLKAKIFMGLMGIGGTIALIGGVMFVYLIFNALIKNLRKNYVNN